MRISPRKSKKYLTTNKDDLIDDFDAVNDDLIDDLIDDFDDEVVDETFDEFDTTFRNNSEVHKIWLDTEPYLNQIYLSITNQKIEKIRVQKGNGRIVYKHKPVPIANGIKPLANDLGISQIMGICRAFISSPLVQANFNNDDYHNEMLSLSIKINRAIYSNRINWGIKLEDVNVILTIVEEAISIFLTRTINNLERARDRYDPNRGGEFQERKAGLIEKSIDRFRRKKGVAV